MEINPQRKNTNNRNSENQSKRSPRPRIFESSNNKFSKSNDEKTWKGGKSDDRKTKTRTERYDSTSRSNKKWNSTNQTQEDRDRRKSPEYKQYRDKDKKYQGSKSNFRQKPRRYETQADIEKKKIEEGTRLNKFISNSGVCSRRDADKYIAAGLVTVNGEIINTMGFRVKPGDKVTYDGSEIKSEKKVYVLLNKPKNYITTVEDTHGRKTVMELISGSGKERIYPVGRLDRNTSGVLMFTNDGEMVKRLTHPSHGVKKVYYVELSMNLKQVHFDKILNGIHLEDGTIYVDKISYVEGASKREIGIELHSGKNRIVRRIFESLGYEVTKLDRVVFAGLTKKNLKRGQWRYLTNEEISFLKMI